MKLIHLFENHDDIDLDELRSFIEEIKKNCSRFLREKNRNENLIRYAWKNDSYYKIKADQIRTKASTDMYLLQYLHKFMKKAGYEATRLQGIFATGVDEKYNLFGDNFHIFLTDDYTLTWSRTFKDMGGDAIHRMAEKDIEFAEFKGKSPKYVQKVIAEYFWHQYEPTLVKDNLREAIRSKNEIMIKASYAYCINKFIFDAPGVMDIIDEIL